MELAAGLFSFAAVLASSGEGTILYSSSLKGAPYRKSVGLHLPMFYIQFGRLNYFKTKGISQISGFLQLKDCLSNTAGLMNSIYFISERH